MNGLSGIQAPDEEHNHLRGAGGPGQERVQPDINGLDAFQDAREIVRLVQCTTCSLPLRCPVALPCGNIICRDCLPKTYTRQGVSFPNTPGRQEGFLCPFGDCGREHPLADCGVDITLAKVMEIFEMTLGESALEPATTDNGKGRRPGRLSATYALARIGQLLYDVELTYEEEEGSDGAADREALQIVRDLACLEMECQVCYGLLFNPITAHCGHTFCRKCLQRVLDHSQLCPSCRQRLQLPSVLPAESSNKRLADILVGICPDALALRAAAVAAEDRVGSDDDELSTPIFVCASSFPGMPTPLFIFEPRYRLMVRRAWEGDRKFGMVLPNKSGEPQGELGVAPFMQCGTMLHIEQVHVYPDGCSHIWTVGVSKFKIKRWGIHDDYMVANVERMDDIPVSEEEALEAMEVMRGASAPWTRLPTRDLLEMCYNFIDQMQVIAAPWMSENNLATFGTRPEDPALFPYWLASVLPIADQERYRLLVSRSARERLVITVTWLKRIERHWWFSSANCNTL